MALNPNYFPDREVVSGILSGLSNDQPFAADAIPATPGPYKGEIILIGGSARYGLADEDGRRAPGGKVHRGPGIGFSGLDYECALYDWEEPMPDEVIRRLGGRVGVPMTTAALATCVDAVKTRRDARFASLLASTSWQYTNTPGAGDRWSASTSNPHAQLLTMKSSFKGAKPNTLIIARDAFDAYHTNANALAALPNDGPKAYADMDFFRSAVMRVLGIQNLIVFENFARTSNDPDDFSNLSRLFAGKVWMGHIHNLPGAQAPTGVAVSPTAVARIQEVPMSDTSYRDDSVKSEIVQVSLSEALVAVTTGLGARLDAVLG